MQVNTMRHQKKSGAVVNPQSIRTNVSGQVKDTNISNKCDFCFIIKKKNGNICPFFLQICFQFDHL